MRFVFVPSPGTVEVHWMWLPTWMGLNPHLKTELEAVLTKELVGKEITEQTLDAANELILDLLSRKFSALRGLRDYLDGIKFVQGDGDKG